MSLVLELRHFFLANLRASYFGAFLLGVFLLTEFVAIPGIARYDLIFLAAVGYQAIVLWTGFEKPREFLVILVFHVLATLMELFKTHPEVGSWTYPAVDEAIFAIGTVPLFTGFMYSAIGSYISRAFVFLRLRYVNFPAQYHLWALAGLIYLNFFTHHFVFDLRYLLFLYAGVVFFPTMVHFRVHHRRWQLPFLATAFLVAGFVWVAENVATFTHIWLYPSQIVVWHLVSVQKIGSWFLLLVLSFALVSIIYQNRLRS